MKANEAPEKLYITYKGYGVFDEDSTVERTKDSQTEYTRTDAFIEKAVKWLENNLQGIVGGSIYIEDFKEYLKK